MSTKIIYRGASPAWLLTILFIGLKLSGHIDWSWIWVVAPLWIFPAVVIGGLLIFGAVTLIIGGIAALGIALGDRWR